MSALAAILRSTLLRNRELTLELARREVMERYAGAALGSIWAVLTPLLTRQIVPDADARGDTRDTAALQVCVCVASDRAVCCFCAVCAVRMRVYADCTRLRAMICDICCVRMPVFADRTFCVPQSELTALRKQVTSLSAQLQERVARDAVCGGPMSIATWPWGSGWCNRARAARRRGRRLCGRPTRQRVYWMVIGCAAALDPIHTYARKHTHTHTRTFGWITERRRA